MRSSKLFMLVTVSIFTLTWLVGLSSTTAQAQEVVWERIEGVVPGFGQPLDQLFDVVGSGSFQPFSGPGSALGAAPWNTTGGSAKVDLRNGDVVFEVKGLVLSVGSVPAFGLTGLPTGTPAGVTQVKGTLVCNLDGSAGGGNSTLVDTPAVSLSAQGDAEFIGNIGPLPRRACVNQSDRAFLIRIVEPAAFVGHYIAFGAVRTP
ncbi:MAG: hypothetical protein HYZ72_07765 [Deltaproteobacteria bacterium]|nr:hypothetical protein [Deltaproteobacteria bacterium]